MRRSILAAALVLFCGQASADPRQDVLNAAARCNAIADYRSWLDCYYGAAQPLRSMLGLQPAPTAQVKLVPPAIPVSAAPAASVQQNPALRANPPADEDHVPVQPFASYSFGDQDRFIVTLANGQTWKQIDDDSVRAHWKGPAQKYRASVVSSLFGSHLMRVSDGHSYRVKRVR
jgi:hypothetical protein